jgi:hypothetical protein
MAVTASANRRASAVGGAVLAVLLGRRPVAGRLAGHHCHSGNVTSNRPNLPLIEPVTVVAVNGS